MELPDMKPGHFSRTALGATVIRALHLEFGDPVIFADRFADILVSEKDRERLIGVMLELISPANRHAALAIDDQGERSAFLLRALPFTANSPVIYRFSENHLEAARRRGVSPYVILGAGLDSHVLRNRDAPERLRVFEVDHPATQELKKNLLRGVDQTAADNTIFVPVDFEREDLRGNLLVAGFDSEQPVFVSWLNVTGYLSREAIMNTLASISSISAAGSGLVFDFYGEGILQQPDDDVARMIRASESVGEPITDGMPLDWLRARLSGLGYASIELARPEEIEDLRDLAQRNGYRFMRGCFFASAEKF
jgi:methyltransferase (TIGR00027 family)